MRNHTQRGRDELDQVLWGVVKQECIDEDQQKAAYKEIASNNDGTCGVKVHEFMSRL